MTARDASVYRCQQCGFASPKAGTCPDCLRAGGGWVQLVEERPRPPRGKRGNVATSDGPRPLKDVTMQHDNRVRTGIGELDRVLGGGVVQGSLVLIGGDPGVGKSTLLLQAASALAQAAPPVLYVTAEESAAQVKMRADRLGVVSDRLLLLAENDLSAVQASLDDVKPRVLEHLVDTVLYFEGEQHHAYRVLRAVKNRFGSTNEIGVFEMAEGGLAEVPNPSGFFLAERPVDAPGSVIVSALEGTRPLLLELQALVSRASFGTPRRTVLGADYNRVCLLLAVLEKRAQLPIGNQDVFVNVAGGGRVVEPAADLAIVLAAASSYMERPLPADVVVLGEVGLTGEVRAVAGLEARLRCAAQLGFRAAIVPRSGAADVRSAPLSVRGVATVTEALEALLP